MAKVKIDKNKCIACGVCGAIAEEIFDYDEEGLAFNKLGENTELDSNLTQLAKDAKDSCPTEAISIDE